MRQDGYTLTETLVALAAIGLAIGGLTAATRTIGRNQSAAAKKLAETRESREVAAALSALLDGQGPAGLADPTTLHGDGASLQFDCKAAGACSAQVSTSGQGAVLQIARGGDRRTLRTPRAAALRFVYVGTEGVSDAWPPASKDPQTLRAILLMDRGRAEATPLATIRMWKEQDAACVFDAISGVCRGAAS